VEKPRLPASGVMMLFAAAATLTNRR